MSASPEQLTPGLWRWTARHPEWHPGEFGAEVASFAAAVDDEAILIDPLLPREPAPVLELLDEIAARAVSILITIPYHVRSAEELWRRYRRRPGCSIWGHPALARRLADDAGFKALQAGAALPAGITAHAIGRPRRFETPIYLPSQRALVFGDALVEAEGRLRIWHNEPVDDNRARWYRERFVPTLEPLLALDPERVLVTHGESFLEDGRARLKAALRARPWYHRG